MEKHNPLASLRQVFSVSYRSNLYNFDEKRTSFS